jgi:hypothetical protein
MKMGGIPAFLAVVLLSQAVQAQTNKYYPSGRSPLLATSYVKLPFGAVRPQGWLDSQLVLQSHSLTGHVDEIFSALATPSGLATGNEYLYCYYEGLIPLAYLLQDTMLLRKANTAINYFIGTAVAGGNFLTSTSIAFDHLCILRALRAFYDITKDSRVIPFMTNYFHYINTSNFSGDGDMWSLNRLPEFMPVAQWLYNHTGDTIILSAVTKGCADTLNSWVNNYNNYTWTDSVNPSAGYPAMYNHNVNMGEAFKYSLYYLQSKNTNVEAIMNNGLALTDKYHGSVGGRFDADEHLTGKQPTRGMELCGITETSYSMEQLFEGFGNVAFADRAEYLMFNCFAGTNTADMWAHQYDQQANQVLVNNSNRPWDGNNSTSNEYGLQPNWPCCLCNQHPTWPRFLEHMWMATQDNGLLAALYGPCQVTAQVGTDTATATITESTVYPFDGTMGFKVTVSKTDSFPISFRIPQWESSASVNIGTNTATPAAGTVYRLNRTWHTGDSVTLTFPMKIRSEYRWNNSVCIMRGPLWYSLKIGETWKQLANNGQGSRDWEIDPATAWNVGLKVDPANTAGSFTVVRNPISRVPFAQLGEQVYLPGATTFTTWTQDPPVILRGQGRIITSWTYNTTYTGNANDPPTSPVASTIAGKDTSIELIPYGSAKLRVTEFPWISTPVAVLSNENRIPKVPELMVTSVKNGKCLFTVNPAGNFDLKLFDIAGRAVYHLNAEGPKSFMLERGTLRNGTYVAHLVSNGRKIEEKISIVQ